MTCSIVGKGRIGGMIKAILPDAHWIGREEPIPSSMPIIVATRWMIPDVVEFSIQDRKNLIFVQNGMIASFLRSILSRCTPLLYVAVSKRELHLSMAEECVCGSQGAFFTQTLQRVG